MGFYIGISRVASGTVNQTDLASVYTTLCQLEGSVSGKCSYDPLQKVLWSPAGAGPSRPRLPAASTQLFGMNTVRDLTFRNSGSIYGVTR